MKILYAMQGTGNGHLARARAIIPLLSEYGEVDILLSGVQAELDLPFRVKYHLRGLSFVSGKNGGIDFWKTWKEMSLIGLWRAIRTFPIQQYELVINDFEPISAWAARLNNVSCIALSHQVGILHRHAPRAKHLDLIGRWMLKYYAPADVNYGLHFQSYGSSIFTPIIRQQIREQAISNQGHYTVYLPTYADEMLFPLLQAFPSVQWEVFSKHHFGSHQEANVLVQGIDHDRFVKSMATCEGVLCSAGFETPAEALYLKKKLLVVSMKRQHEQACNAATLASMGVPVIHDFTTNAVAEITAWLNTTDKVEIDYPDMTEQLVEMIVDVHVMLKKVFGYPRASGLVDI